MKYDVITLGSATQDIFMASSDLQVVEGDQFITKKRTLHAIGLKDEKWIVLLLLWRLRN